MSRVQNFVGNVTNGNVNFADGGRQHNGSTSGSTTLKPPVTSVIHVGKDGVVTVDGKPVCKIPETGATLVFEGDVQDVNLGTGSVVIHGNVYGTVTVKTGAVEVKGQVKK